MTAKSLTPKQVEQQKTKAFRAALKASGVKASVRYDYCCGDHCTNVFVSEYGLSFSPEEQKTVQRVALDLNMTYVQGYEVNADHVLAFRDTFQFVH